MSQFIPLAVIIFCAIIIIVLAVKLKGGKAALESVATNIKAHVALTAAGLATNLKEHVTTTSAKLGDAIVAKVAPAPAGAAVTFEPAAPAPTVAEAPPPAPAAAPSPTVQPVPSGSGPTTADHASDQFYTAAIAAKAIQQQNEAYTGPVPASSLQDADWKFLWWATINPATPKMHNWEYTVLSGTRAEIQQGLAHIGNDIARMRGYDATKYAGVLRSHYDAAVKV